ncbi:hypothetical protein SBOR_4044 [Sclerotinia borealis F-4128]|uniref:Restriction of telomere capping protein 4 n=1 Tax=Sclerotinia borealis (strain F-4128) TaxID=1432307 RepID=W9CLM5_SCLBF|nr:hypothetical protein SBOR_4044 [Sclerotinia borealis F-4128]
MYPTKLDLDDSRKLQPRRAGLTKHYRQHLLQSVNRPKKEGQPEMPSKAGIETGIGTGTGTGTGTKTLANNANIVKISGDASDANPTRSQKREDKGSDKENQLRSLASSAMKNTILIEDDDDIRLPDDSDDGPKYAGDSSDDELPSRVSADMTKTSFGPKKNESSQTSTKSPVPSRKNTRTKLSEPMSSTGVKRKKEEDDLKHDPKVDLFGNMQSGKKKLKSYMQVNKEHEALKPGANNISVKKYGKKKTTTYGKKPSPAKVFKNYGNSSPSLVSDDGKEKLQDYTTDTPTRKQSPIKGGLIRPDFSDDDSLDLDYFTKLQSGSAPSPILFKQLQRYDDDDIMDGAEELAKRLNPETIIGMERFEREDSLDLDDYIGSRCPMCNEPVAAEDLEAFGEMNTRKQEKFCLSHQRKSALSDWESKGYPDIDWTALDSRIASHHTFIKKIIDGASCHSRSVLDETIRAGKDRNLMKSTTNLIPGYYGSRGLRIISENIMNKFTPKLKERAPIDRLIAARGPTAFVESVVVPEVTVLLIKEDMNVADEEAREILKESCEMGELVNEEIKDVVKLKPKKRKQVKDSDGDEDEDEDEDENIFDF